MRKTIPAIVVLALLSGLAATPSPAAPHITDFTLGITREETLLRAAAPCGDNLCGEVSFGGKNWGGTFLFKNNALSAITLFGPLDDAYVEAAFAGFAESPYVVYRAITDDGEFDFPRKAAEGLTSDQQDAAFQEFLQGMGSTGHTFASYFYTEPAVYEALKEAAVQAASHKEKAAGAASGPGSEQGRAPGRDQVATGQGRPAPDAKTDPTPDTAARETPTPKDPPVGTPGGASSRAATSSSAPTAQAAPEDGKAAGQNSAPPPASVIPDGITCMLTIDEDGVTIIIMSRADLQHELARRSARASVRPAKKPASAVSGPSPTEGNRQKSDFSLYKGGPLG